jgi:hypothetical protein
MICRSSFSLITAVLVSLGALFGSPAAATQEKAVQAARMLSPERWAQAVRIENTNQSSRYPETVYATVFEVNDTLWFFTATGSQPLRLSKNRTAEYKENLLPLLRTIDRGFTSFTRIDAEETEGEESFPSLKNGCVVESIYSLDALQREGTPILQAKMLLYSSKNPARSHAGRATGHAVLVYQTPEGFFYIDPPKIDVTGAMTKTREWDPKEMAREIESHYGKIQIESAFFEEFPVAPPRLASNS